MQHSSGDVIQFGDVVITVQQVSNFGTTLMHELNVSLHNKVSFNLFLILLFRLKQNF